MAHLPRRRMVVVMIADVTAKTSAESPIASGVFVQNVFDVLELWRESLSVSV
jgi:hypothetical protein